MANERARSLFGLTPRDLGRVFQDLGIMYRIAELRSLMEQAVAERRLAVVRETPWQLFSGEVRYLDVQVVPLVDGGTLLGLSLSFIDVTEHHQLREELQHTNEELETTNEELQSTNEELETMNEELQSTNEELQTVNDELQRRSEDLNQANGFLHAVLSSLRQGVVVVDRELVVDAWNDKAADLWGLRAEEARGRYLLGLDIGLPLEQLRQPIRSCLTGETGHLEITLPATNRRGKPIEVKVSCTPMPGEKGMVRGAILFIEERAGGGRRDGEDGR